MTGYTDNRGYPYPSSEREAGNGGLHSELLARAVARDLDPVDAAWAAGVNRDTSTMTRGADLSAYFNSNQVISVPFDTLEHGSTGATLIASVGSGTFIPPKGWAGWYHFSVVVHTVASGTVTANVRHRVGIARMGNLYNTFQDKEVRWCDTFQPPSGDIYNAVEGVMHVEYGDTIEARYYHLNASSMTFKALGSRFGATLIVAG